MAFPALGYLGFFPWVIFANLVSSLHVWFYLFGLMWGCSSDDASWCFISVGFSVGSEEVVSGGWFVSAVCE